MAKHTFTIGDIECHATRKTAAMESAVQQAAFICQSRHLAPTIVWGCPGQSDPTIVAIQVGGYGTFRPGRTGPTGVYGDRQLAIVNAAVHVAQTAWGERAAEYGPHHFTDVYADWLRKFLAQTLAPFNRSADAHAATYADEFLSWAKWQKAYALARAAQPDAGDEVWRAVANKAA